MGWKIGQSRNVWVWKWRARVSIVCYRLRGSPRNGLLLRSRGVFGRVLRIIVWSSVIFLNIYHQLDKIGLFQGTRKKLYVPKRCPSLE